MSKATKKRIIETLGRCEDIENPKDYYEQLTTLKNQFDSNLKMQFLIKVMEALGNPDRVLILDALREKDRCVCEIEAILSKSQSNISHHLSILERANLLRGWKKGKFTHYSLIEPEFKKFMTILDNWVSSISNWFG